LTGVTIKAPGASQPLAPPLRQASHSHGDISPTSGDGSNAARIAVLEKKQGELEKRVGDLERKLVKLGG